MRAVNQLQALLRALLAGGAPTELTAATAAGCLRALDARLLTNSKALAAVAKASGSSLTETVGVGPVIAARLISRTGPAGRLPSAAAYANYAGAAPVASADKSRHRLSRTGESTAKLGVAHGRD